MNKSKKKLFIGVLGLCLMSGTAGVYAGTIIDSYKTPRGNIATVEPIDVHNNRIAITVNGTTVSKNTWYADGVTYAPLRDVAEMLGASVNYNSETMAADIITESKILDLYGLKINTPYYGEYTNSWNSAKHDAQFKITNFNPSTSAFKGTVLINKSSYDVTGTISEAGIAYSYVVSRNIYAFTLDYDGSNNMFSGASTNGAYMVFNVR